MRTEGLFFLCGRPLHAPAGGHVDRWLLPLLEREGRGTTHVTASWRGSEARAFVEAHRDQLVPGCPLRLELEHLHAAALPAGAELRARVARAELAPTRWPARRAQPADFLPQQQPAG